MTIPKILDVTLRDGSYEIGFRFTSSDTATICRELESAGIEYIEVGHGVGLNASNRGFGEAAQTDREYMEAAAGSLTKTKWGMFCIPGIARLEDVDTAHKYGMHFIRIGTNVTDVAQSKPFIERAKHHGMFVAANYMKSYALSPDEFSKQVLLSEAFGADMIYIVDSAGGMFPNNIEDYYRAIRNISNIPVGFHGHHNLDLALANSLAAAEMGISFIDASLQGLGRSAGNTCTETLVAALIKRGFPMNLDLKKLMHAGQTYIQPLLTAKGRMPLDITAGFADFHSSYMPHIERAASKFGVDPLDVMIEYSRFDKVNMDHEVLESIASKMKTKAEISLARYGFHRYIGGEQEHKQS